MRILVISGIGADARYLQKAFAEAAHSLECMSDVRDALFVASSEAFDAVILHMSAIGNPTELVDVARELARNVQGATLVVIADLPTPTLRSELLWIGVDACFPRSFSFMEVHERIRRLAALRAKGREGEREQGPEQGPDQRYVAAEVAPDAGPARLELDAQARAAVQGARRVALTRHEYLLVECLLRAREAAISRAEITRYAWPDKDDINPSSVNLVISRLRKKLETGGFDVCIETVAGVGYRLVVASGTAVQRQPLR